MISISAMRTKINLVFRLIRTIGWRLMGVGVGAGTQFDANVRINHTNKVSIGRHSKIGAGAIFKCGSRVGGTKRTLKICDAVTIGEGTIIECNEAIEIGANSLIAPNCYITDSSHKYDVLDVLIRDQPGRYRKVKIGEDVWIGCNCVILDGVEIGDGCVVGANSLIRSDIPPYSVVIGSPGRVIKTRNE